MPPRRRTDEELAREFTGLVVESLAVRQDVTRRTVQCAACAHGTDGRGPTLGVGDPVVVVFREYEGFTWEIQDLFCTAHRVDQVADAVGVLADDQAVVSAVLEAAGYHSPDGTYYPDALTLGDVGVLDYSPAAEGYAEETDRGDPRADAEVDPDRSDATDP